MHICQDSAFRRILFNESVECVLHRIDDVTYILECNVYSNVLHHKTETILFVIVTSKSMNMTLTSHYMCHVRGVPTTLDFLVLQSMHIILDFNYLCGVVSYLLWVTVIITLYYYIILDNYLTTYTST